MSIGPCYRSRPRLPTESDSIHRTYAELRHSPADGRANASPPDRWNALPQPRSSTDRAVSIRMRFRYSVNIAANRGCLPRASRRVTTASRTASSSLSVTSEGVSRAHVKSSQSSNAAVSGGGERMRASRPLDCEVRRRKPRGPVGSPFVGAHSITRSARNNTPGGIARPSDLAVRRFTISSNVVGCSTGRSAGLVPFRIFSTKMAARRHMTGRSVP